MKRIMVFIDGNNFESAVNNLYGSIQRINYEKLANYIAHKASGHLQRYHYYTAACDSTVDKEKHDRTMNFVGALNKTKRCIAKAGYLKYEGKNAEGKDIFVEKRTDVNIAVDLVSLAFTNAYDEAILLSADTDYEPAIDMVRRLGKVMTVCLVDRQKAGYLKDLCDDHMILTKEDIDQVKR